MGTPLYPLVFAKLNLGAAQTDLSLTHGDAAGAEEALAPYPGEIVALTVSGGGNRTAGSATFEIRVNGVKLASPVAVIDASNVRRLRVEVGHEAGRTIKADDTVEVVVTTSADFAPTTIEYAADVWCTVGSYAPG